MRQAEARGAGGEGDGDDADDAGRVARSAAAGGAAAGRAIIDLDSLAFSQGSHFMSKKACVLPPGSYRCVIVLVCACLHVFDPVWLCLCVLSCRCVVCAHVHILEQQARAANAPLHSVTGCAVKAGLCPAAVITGLH